ncbi:MAG: hypothetical protein VB018_12300 [Lachnospiraceae bacterium]|nr:hypothetical protein [Lachnospiraceae bacterium]
MKKRLIGILLIMCMLMTILPVLAMAATQEVSILSYPTKIVYKVGEGFDTTGLKVVKNANGKETNVNSKMNFYTSKTVELTQGRPFTTAGTKVVELRYEGKKMAEYTIKVTADSDTAKTDKMKALPALSLYKVDYRNPKDAKELTAPNMWSNWNAPYRLSPGGDIHGEIPWGTVLEATATDGMWIKVKYAGRECYIFHDKASKVSEPDIVCSPWAKEQLKYYNGYIGTKNEWPNAKNDWTKAINRGDMAVMIFLAFNNGEAPYQDDMPFYKKEHFTDIKFNDFIDGKNVGAAANFLASMGVIPSGGKFNAAGNLTYGEFSEFIIKLSVYMDKYYYDGNLGILNESGIKKFLIGGDTSASAKITKEQARIMCEKYSCWFWETYDMQVEATHGGSLMASGGTFVINVGLGKYPNQPYLVIDADGKGELSNTKMQKFKVTYKKSVPKFNKRNATLLVDDTFSMKLFTIQTENGKYLAIDGLPQNGSRLITQDKEFLWWINSNIQGGYAAGSNVNIMVPGFYDQRLNASGRSSKDGTHIITWYEENKWRDAASDHDYPFNTNFTFHMVNGPNSNVPTVPTKYLHGVNIQSYPTKTTYKVGEGFDATGFKVMYLDENNGGKVTDITSDYKFVTSDGVLLTQGYKFTTPGTKIVAIVEKDADIKTLYTSAYTKSNHEGKIFITVN